MSSDRELLRRVEALIAAQCEARLTPEEHAELQRLLLSSEAAQWRYLEYLDLHSNLAWDMTRSAAPSEAPAGEAFQKSPVPLVPTRGEKLWGYLARPLVYSLITAAVTVVSLLLTTAQIPLGPLGHEPRAPQVAQPTVAKPGIAQVQRTIDLEWSETGLATGMHFTAGRKLRLQRGLAELVFRNGTRLILQGPGEFTVVSEHRVDVAQGRLTAQVPAAARGFTVSTPSSLVIDLGTEFGVSVNDQRQTEAHVFSGRVEVVPRDPQAGEKQTLTASQALLLTADWRQTRAIAAAPQKFVRTLPEQLWRRLELSDLLAGGNGLGEGNEVGIDVATGQLIDTPLGVTIASDGRVHPVPGLATVDCVFIPTGPEPFAITTAGHTFSFAATNGRLYGPLWAGDLRPLKISTELGGVDYASPVHRLLGMHANQGITFDLDAIRQLHPGWKLTRFLAVGGNTEQVTAQGGDARADLRVLVDGQPRFVREHLRGGDGPIEIEIAIEPSSRFLTLVATDGGDSIGSDWIVLGDPRFELSVQVPKAADSTLLKTP